MGNLRLHMDCMPPDKGGCLVKDGQCPVLGEVEWPRRFSPRAADHDPMCPAPEALPMDLCRCEEYARVRAHEQAAITQQWGGVSEYIMQTLRVIDTLAYQAEALAHLRVEVEGLRNEAAAAAADEIESESHYAYYRGYVRGYERVLALIEGVEK